MTATATATEDQARALAARLLCVPEHEISDVRTSAEGLLITSSNVAYIVAPEDRPDAEGKTGLMLLEARRGWHFPVYRPVVTLPTKLAGAGDLATSAAIAARRDLIDQQLSALRAFAEQSTDTGAIAEAEAEADDLRRHADVLGRQHAAALAAEAAEAARLARLRAAAGEAAKWRCYVEAESDLAEMAAVIGRIAVKRQRALAAGADLSLVGFMRWNPDLLDVGHWDPNHRVQIQRERYQPTFDLIDRLSAALEQHWPDVLAEAHRRYTPPEPEPQTPTRKRRISRRAQ